VHPDDLKYTAEHEWVRPQGDTVRAGITDYAQEQLGDVVYVSLPEVGATVAAGDACGEVESTKSVSDIYAPVSGTVTDRNAELDQHPDLINTDPYGAGWLLEISPTSADAADGLLDAATYRAQIGEETPST
jgi:glycine cleavage system H protein